MGRTTRSTAGKGTTSFKKASSGGSRVQVKNPITDRWVKIDTTTGRIVDTKKSPGPYKGIPKK